MSDCVHKTAVIVCLSGEGGPREAALTTVMACRPFAEAGLEEYRIKFRPIGDENIDAGYTILFLRVLVISELCNKPVVVVLLQPQTQYFVPSARSPRAGGAGRTARVDLPQY